jgi:hypothetical protein
VVLKEEWEEGRRMGWDMRVVGCDEGRRRVGVVDFVQLTEGRRSRVRRWRCDMVGVSVRWGCIFVWNSSNPIQSRVYAWKVLDMVVQVSISIYGESKSSIDNHSRVQATKEQIRERQQ